MGEFWSRLKLSFAAFFTILFKGRLPEALRPAPAAPVAPAPPVPDVDPHASALQIVTLMQRDGRLVDFLMEDLTPFTDAQIGATVRDVHAACRRVLDRYVTLEPILDGREGEAAAVEAVDPATIRLVGNVAGQPPFRGTLLHRGWRVTRIDLPPLAPPASRRIVAQAEVEVA